jgi:hypothetical protein
VREHILFGLVVFGDGGGEGGEEEAGCAEEHENSVCAEVGGAVHGDAPE